MALTMRHDARPPAPTGPGQPNRVPAAHALASLMPREGYRNPDLPSTHVGPMGAGMPIEGARKRPPSPFALSGLA